MLESITCDKLKNGVDGVIIDIRSNDKYKDSHILYAINIPFEQLLINHKKYLNQYDKYYIYCQKGFKSKKLCMILKRLGYNVININGGYDAWKIG